MSRTPNFPQNPYSSGIPSRNPGFPPYTRLRSPMGPPDGPRGGYFPPQQGTPVGSPGMMPGLRYPSRNSSPFSPPSFHHSPHHDSPYHQSPGSSPRESGGGSYHRRDSRGRGRGRGGRGGDHFTPTGHQQFHNRRRFSGGSPYQRGQHGDSSSDIERYFKPSMLEDPWKHLTSQRSTPTT